MQVGGKDGAGLWGAARGSEKGTKAHPWMRLLQSPLPTWEELSSLKRVHPLLHVSAKAFLSEDRRLLPLPLPLPRANSFGPQFSRPWLGEDPEQPLWDDVTQRPACRVVSHLDTCSQLTPAWAALGRQHPKRQMPESASREPACSEGGSGSQEDRVSIGVSICLSPSLCATVGLLCSGMPGEHFLNFSTCVPECQSSDSSGQFSKGWDGGGAVCGFFPSLKSCLRFPWLGLK